jgi:hypothetical protein
MPPKLTNSLELGQELSALRAPRLTLLKSVREDQGLLLSP